MTAQTLHGVGIVVTAALVIFALRAVPFALFAHMGESGGRFLRACEKWLSPAVIAMLVAYSYAGLEWRTPSPYVAGAVVVAMQLKFRNGLVSILVGTAVYMLLVRL